MSNDRSSGTVHYYISYLRRNPILYWSNSDNLIFSKNQTHDRTHYAWISKDYHYSITTWFNYLKNQNI